MLTYFITDPRLNLTSFLMHTFKGLETFSSAYRSQIHCQCSLRSCLYLSFVINLIVLFTQNNQSNPLKSFLITFLVKISVKVFCIRHGWHTRRTTTKLLLCYLIGCSQLFIGCSCFVDFDDVIRVSCCNFDPIFFS